MKPFDLQSALSGKPVITRDGRKVTEMHYFETANDVFCIAAIINGEINTWTRAGHYDTETDISPFDLFMAAEKVTKWVNVYAGSYIAHIYDTEEIAKAHASKTCIATVPITFEV